MVYATLYFTSNYVIFTLKLTSVKYFTLLVERCHNLYTKIIYTNLYRVHA